MLDITRDQMKRKLGFKPGDFDFDTAFVDLNRPQWRVTPPQEIRDHYVALVSFLKRNKWDSQRIADFLGVARQTSYQYGFKPESRGARIIPADKLDRLREVATTIWTDRRESEFPIFLTRSEFLWSVFVDIELVLETTSPWRAAWHAARHNGVIMPGIQNTKNDDDRLSENDHLCLRWLEFRHGGLITKADAMCAAGVDEWLVERVGHENAAWRIQPTKEQVTTLSEIYFGRLKHVA